MVVEIVKVWNFVFSSGVQKADFKFGEWYRRTYTHYTRLKISARVGDIRVFARTSLVQPESAFIGTLTEAQIAAGATPMSPPQQESGSLARGFFVVGAGVGPGFDTGDCMSEIGDADLLTIFNPTAGVLAEVQIELRIRGP